MSHASPTMCMRGVCDHDVSWACPVDGQSSVGQYLGGAKGKKKKFKTKFYIQLKYLP